MWQYMLDKDHFYDLRDLPVGHWSASKLQMTKNSIWMHFHEPNSNKYYNTANPIDFKKPYTPPPRSRRVKSSVASVKSSSSSPRYVCDNDSFAITNDNLQIMNEEDAYRNPKPIIPVVGTYGRAITPKSKLRTKDSHKTLKDLASIPTTTRSVRTIRALTAVPANANRAVVSRSNPKFKEINKSKNSSRNQNNQSLNQGANNQDMKIYFSLKKGNEDNQTEAMISKNSSDINTNTENNSNSINNTNEEADSNLNDNTNHKNASNMKSNININDDPINNDMDPNYENVIFVHSSQEDREAAHAKRTLQILERKERKFEQQIPSFTVCGDTTVISNSADIDSNIATNKAVIFSDDLPDPPIYIDKRYGDNGHKNPLRISQIEIRKQFKDALDNGKLDDYDSDYEYEIEEIYDENDEPLRHNTAVRSQDVNVIREKRSARSRSSTINARRNLYKTKVNYRNDEENDNDGPMLTRKQYFNSASKIPNIGSLAYDL